MADRDVILNYTNNTKVQKKIITEYLSYEDTLKYGLVMEHSDKKVKELGRNLGEEEDRGAAFESQVQKLQLGEDRKKENKLNK